MARIAITSISIAAPPASANSPAVSDPTGECQS
jgi:hypothetical protein